METVNFADVRVFEIGSDFKVALSVDIHTVLLKPVQTLSKSSNLNFFESSSNRVFSRYCMDTVQPSCFIYIYVEKSGCIKSEYNLKITIFYFKNVTIKCKGLVV